MQRSPELLPMWFLGRGHPCRTERCQRKALSTVTLSPCQAPSWLILVYPSFLPGWTRIQPGLISLVHSTTSPVAVQHPPTLNTILYVDASHLLRQCQSMTIVDLIGTIFFDPCRGVLARGCDIETLCITPNLTTAISLDGTLIIPR